MQKLKQLAEGEYFLGNQPVIPMLVYGPVRHDYSVESLDSFSDFPIDSLVQRIRAETGVDLEKIANSYHSGGISVAEQNGKITLHHVFFFFNSRPKPSN